MSSGNHDLLLLASVLLVLSVLPVTESGPSGESALYKTLLEDYEVLERPVDNYTDAVEVHLKIELQQIIDIDEKNQIIEMNVWLHYNWYDKRLSWDPSQFDNVADIRLPPDRIWKPDVLLFNSVDDSFDSTFPSNILVYNTGFIDWIPPAITRSSCSLTITWFPFDEQECYLKFGSWSYTKDKISLLSDGTDTSEYKLVLNGEWTLMDTPVQIQDVDYGEGHVYRYLYFKFRLRRRTLYFGFNMIAPSLLIAIMSIWGFMIPAESGEKVTLEMTVLLSICVFMGMVAQVTPITSESVPLLSVFCFCHMIAVTVSIVFSVLVLNFYFRTPQTHSMSNMTRNILLNWLPWLLMMKRPNHVLQPPPIFTAARKSDSYTDSLCLETNEINVRNRSFYRRVDTPQPKYAFFDRTRSTTITIETNKINSKAKVYFDDEVETEAEDADSPKANGGGATAMAVDPEDEMRLSAENCVDMEQRMEKCLRAMSDSDNPASIAVLGRSGGFALQAMLLSLQQINNELRFITERHKREDENEDVLNDWKFAAMAIDRLCLYFFSVFIITATFGVLFSAPHLMA